MSATQYSAITTAATTAIIITTYIISTTYNVSGFSHLCPCICSLTPSAVFISVCICVRSNVGPSPSSAFIRSNTTRTDTNHSTPPATYIQRCEYCHKILSAFVTGSVGYRMQFASWFVSSKVEDKQNSVHTIICGGENLLKSSPVVHFVVFIHIDAQQPCYFGNRVLILYKSFPLYLFLSLKIQVTSLLLYQIIKNGHVLPEAFTYWHLTIEAWVQY
jgi:hypothetical protein